MGKFNVVVFSNQDPKRKFVLKSYPRFEDAITYASLHLRYASKIDCFLNVEEEEKE